MKFGKYLAKRHLDLPEYAEYFINYKQLKKLINRLAGDDPREAHQRLQAQKATFFFQLERELEKVQGFYQEKEKDLEARLSLLVSKLAAARQAGISLNSASYIGLHEGFHRFRRDLEKLEEFIDLNGIGFSKVLKKWDKRSLSHTKELFLRRAVEIQPMFNREILVSMGDKANKCFLELEALSTGDTVYEPEVEPHQTNAVEDLVQEFFSFAAQYDPSDESSASQIKEWSQQLLSCNPPKLSYAFRTGITTNATNEALLALYEEKNVDLTEIDEYSGKGCLHYAASHANRDPIVKLCLSKNPGCVNLQDQYGRTALHYAAIKKALPVIKQLLQANADVNILDNDNYRALHYALFYNLPEITEIFLDHGALLTGNSERDYIPLNFACQFGAEAAIKVLLKKNSKPDMVTDAEGLYPLHIVARAGYYRLVEVLLDAGADINQVDKLNSWTPLIYAAAAGNSSTVKALLQHNANIAAVDERGYSALFYACWQGHAKSITELSSNLPHGPSDTSSSICCTASASKDKAQAAEMELEIEDDLMDLDGIPALSLPPPIIPIQRYGHSFLDSQKVILQIMFDNDPKAPSLQFKDDRRILSAGRLTISTSSSKDSIARNIDLPIKENDRVQTFQIENLKEFWMDFEVLPTFGTKVMVKATALPSIFEKSRDTGVSIAFFNVLLHAVGVLSFDYLMVTPFTGQPLEITKFDTYWKSTSFIESSTVDYPLDHYHATNASETIQASTFNVVTASSLQGAYKKSPVVLTADKVLVVSDPLLVSRGIAFPVMALTLDTLRKLDPSLETLQEYLEKENADQLNLYIPYPSVAELNDGKCPLNTRVDLNEYADLILSEVFRYVRKSEVRKSFVFSSPCAELCAVINWKQPNYPVLFVMNGLCLDGTYQSCNGFIKNLQHPCEAPRCFSPKDAARFAATNNLMGLVLPEGLIRIAPPIVPAVRILGLMVVAQGDHASDIVGLDGWGNGDTMYFDVASDSS